MYLHVLYPLCYFDEIKHHMLPFLELIVLCPGLKIAAPIIVTTNITRVDVLAPQVRLIK
jgi:hypothetical protein